MPSRRCIPIDSSNSNRGKKPAQFLFNLLCAFAYVVNIFSTTPRTFGRRGLAMIAVVTNDYALTAMICQRDVAVGTLNAFTAGAAEYETRVAATIQQND